MYHSDIYEIEYANKLAKAFEAKAFCIALNITLKELYEETDAFFK